MTQGQSNLVDVSCTFLHETDLAILVEEGFEKIWLQKSLIEIDDSSGSAEIIVTMPEWLAMEKGLI